MSMHACYGVDMDDVFRVKSWRWFSTRVSGLMAMDSPLAAHFRPDPEPETPEVPLV